MSVSCPHTQERERRVAELSKKIHLAMIRLGRPFVLSHVNGNGDARILKEREKVEVVGAKVGS